MTISTILPGRLPISLLGRRLQEAVENNRASLSNLQEQLSSGRKFLLPSDLPVQALQALTIQTLSQRQDSVSGNAVINDGYLGSAEQSLSTVSDALNRARSIVQEGIGDSATDSQRQALAAEVATITQSVLNAANLRYNGRYLFAGTESLTTPFTMSTNGVVRYGGDQGQIQTFADISLLLSSNVDGASAFGALSQPISKDINPALTLSTSLGDLYDGAGVVPGRITITVDNGTPITKTVDLTGSRSIADVKTRIEDAFALEAETVSVGINAAGDGIQLTPSNGTIAVADPTGSRSAQLLGIASTPVAQINGGNLEPALTESTPVAALNGGAGIAATLGTGLRIVNGTRTSIVDLNGATTVGDVLNRIRLADPDLAVGISADGRGIAISTRLSGVNFSIGENGGTDATDLGVRTLTGTTRVADLNYGVGLTTEPTSLSITRRDGSSVSVDLAGAVTVQDVLDRVNAVDPGHLVASLVATGNGISLTDDSGAGALTVASSNLSKQLGMDGTDDGGAAGVLNGRDVNPRQADGIFTVLSQLETALRTNDNATLSRLVGRIDLEASRVAEIRGEIGTRQNLLSTTNTSLKDAAINTKATLSLLIDADLADVVTQLTQKQQILQATYQVASQTLKMTILNYI